MQGFITVKRGTIGSAFTTIRDSVTNICGIQRIGYAYIFWSDMGPQILGSIVEHLGSIVLKSGKYFKHIGSLKMIF